MFGKLFLIPSTIGDQATEDVLPAGIQQVINSITHYIVENERTARRMLIKMGIQTPIDDLKFYLLNKHTNPTEIGDFLKPLEKVDMGVLSEAGVPAVADPGSEVVRLAHQKNIEVVPLVGPSSILLAMMASGMNGQNFAFVGYLPVNSGERIRRLKDLEQRSFSENQSQLFIEAPYRNNQLLKDIFSACGAQTELCIAANLQTDNGFVKTKPLSAWRKSQPNLHKLPCIFILHKKF